MDAGELLTATGKLALACLFGGIIGWQREAHDRPAGFRTHILVSVGSCLVMIVSQGVARPGGLGDPRFDPGRIAAQVVSGIGFLGAGTILRQGSIVRGLTTAASLWTVAAVGLAVGLGGSYAVIAAIATALVLLTLTLLSRIEGLLIAHRRQRDLQLTLPQVEVSSVVRFFTDRGVSIKAIQSGAADAEGMQRLHLVLRLPPRMDTDALTGELMAIPELRAVAWD